VPRIGTIRNCLRCDIGRVFLQGIASAMNALPGMYLIGVSTMYPVLNGSKSRMVSTDGHRLSKVERTMASGPKLSAGVTGCQRCIRFGPSRMSSKNIGEF
jgi:hypothetical protein